MKFYIEGFLPRVGKEILCEEFEVFEKISKSSILTPIRAFEYLYEGLDTNAVIENWKKKHFETVTIDKEDSEFIYYRTNVTKKYVEFNTLEEFVEFVKDCGSFEFDGECLNFIDY